MNTNGPACRVCGCTETTACLVRDDQLGGWIPCHWITPDLGSLTQDGPLEGPLCSGCLDGARSLTFDEALDALNHALERKTAGSHDTLDALLAACRSGDTDKLQQLATDARYRPDIGPLDPRTGRPRPRRDRRRRWHRPRDAEQ